jgi:hypothetical protein
MLSIEQFQESDDGVLQSTDGDQPYLADPEDGNISSSRNVGLVFVCRIQDDE